MAVHGETSSVCRWVTSSVRILESLRTVGKTPSSNPKKFKEIAQLDPAVDSSVRHLCAGYRADRGPKNAAERSQGDRSSTPPSALGVERADGACGSEIRVACDERSLTLGRAPVVSRNQATSVELR